MNTQQVYNKVISIVSEHFHRDIDTLSGDLEYIKDLSADSVDIITLILLFEDSFGISFPFNKGLYTISDTVETISTLINDEQ